MNMMRMDPNGKNLVCRNCLERKSLSQTSSPKEIQETEKESVKEYFCKECKYSFSRARHLVVSTCPYCSSSGSIMVKGSIAKMIADASKMKGD